ncbi:MAG: acetylxylan esterase [Sediminibacterium sp.]|jgi:cephalosporin-C deacetylase
MSRKKFLFCSSALILLFQIVIAIASVEGQTSSHQKKEVVLVSVEQAEKSGTYSPQKKLSFLLSIKNISNEEQGGLLSYQINNESSVRVLENAFDLNIPAKKNIKTRVDIPFNIDGSFAIKFKINLNGVSWQTDFGFNFSSNGGARSQEEGFNISIKPDYADGVFVGKAPIIYTATIKNTYKERAVGTLHLIVKDAVTGAVVSEKKTEINVAKRSNKKLFLNIAPPVKPGVYNIDFIVTTANYEDTVCQAFAYEIANINNPYHRPVDFTAFWKNAMNDLAVINPAYHIQELLEESTKSYRVYRVDMRSLDNIGISGLLTIPTTLIGSKFPVLVGYGGYQVKMQQTYFDDFASFMINPRGTDKDSMQEINPDKKELLTLNISDPQKYVYRGIYMDCVRAIDFLYQNEQLGFDLSRIAVFGGSQGGSLALVVSGLLGNKIQTCLADNPTFCDFNINLMMEPNIKEASFILKYFNNYIKENKGSVKKEDLLQTLNYFEVQNFIPLIKCPVLMGIGLLDPLAPATTTIGAYNKLNQAAMKESEIYIFPDLAHEVPKKYNSFKSIWFYEKLAKGKKTRL